MKNITISVALFDKLISVVENRAEEIAEEMAYYDGFTETDIKERNAEIASLNGLAKFCRRCKAANEHGRQIKGQTGDLSLDEAMDFMQGAGMDVFIVDENGILPLKEEDDKK
jgi:hypothetical protein